MQNNSLSARDVNRHQFKSGDCKATPPFWGSKIVNIRSKEIYNLLSHKLLFETRWGYTKGKLSEKQHKKLIEETAKPALYKLIEQDEKDNIFDVSAVYGYYRCISNDESIHILEESNYKTQFLFPRQKNEPYLCLSDFVNDKESDIIALWALTLGSKVQAVEQQFYNDGRYKDYFFLHALGAELANCAAIYLHKHIQRELFGNEPVTNKNIRGCRYAFGYPACPDLSMQQQLSQILDTKRISISYTESWQMIPELSVAGFIIFNTYARWFNIK